ncbi:MAG: Uma2 family endonuclease [Gammaproteobacteria bacterium]|nr:MAG: Uma2 family endonuclease [Gammaproteobacteria bacterium]
MATTAVRPHLWTRNEYDRMIEAGIFHPESHLELIEGEVLTMTPQGSRHMTAIRLVETALREVFSIGHDVRTQAPLALDERSEPEPDVAVVTGTPRDYRDAHPATAVLVVEVADSTLSFDRGRKKALYARAGIAEYWIVNLDDSQLEVSRHAEGVSYAEQQTVSPGNRIAPLARPDSPIAVDDLLP